MVGLGMVARDCDSLVLVVVTSSPSEALSLVVARSPWIPVGYFSSVEGWFSLSVF